MIQVVSLFSEDADIHLSESATPKIHANFNCAQGKSHVAMARLRGRARPRRVRIKAIGVNLTSFSYQRFVQQLHLPVPEVRRTSHPSHSNMTGRRLAAFCAFALLSSVPFAASQDSTALPSTWPHVYPGQPSGGYSPKWQSCS